jgi:hypothetical protein
MKTKSSVSTMVNKLCIYNKTSNRKNVDVSTEMRSSTRESLVSTRLTDDSDAGSNKLIFVCISV